jgi:hypothetical protein
VEGRFWHLDSFLPYLTFQKLYLFYTACGGSFPTKSPLHDDHDQPKHIAGRKGGPGREMSNHHGTFEKDLEQIEFV